MSAPNSAWSYLEFHRTVDRFAGLTRRAGEHPHAWRRADLRLEVAAMAFGLAPFAADAETAGSEALAALIMARGAVGDIASARRSAGR